MSQLPPAPLPFSGRNLLRAAAWIVPSAERAEWTCTWQAELWHMHHRHRDRRTPAVADLFMGLILDAVWLRTEDWRRTFTGTPTLCLVSLLGWNMLAAAVAASVLGSWHALSGHLGSMLGRSVLAAHLVLLVALLSAPGSHVEAEARASWLRRRFFLAVKILLVLSVAFLFSATVGARNQPLERNIAVSLQLIAFVLFAVVGLRWTWSDQEQRCKQCLRALSGPARVGRPSRNLLEWNGTELSCRRGHGRLSVPELETSWCGSSRWIRRTADGDAPESD